MKLSTFTYSDTNPDCHPEHHHQEPGSNLGRHVRAISLA